MYIEVIEVIEVVVQEEQYRKIRCECVRIVFSGYIQYVLELQFLHRIIVTILTVMVIRCPSTICAVTRACKIAGKLRN